MEKKEIEMNGTKMRGGLVLVVLATVLAMSSAGTAVAGTLNGVSAWAQKIGTNAFANFLISTGITNPVDRAAISASWDEDVYVGTALTNKAFYLLSHGMTMDTFSSANRERIKAEVSAARETADCIQGIAMAYPVAERAVFQAALEPGIAVRWAGRPEQGRLYLKYTVLLGMPVIGSETSAEDLMHYLLAPEALSMGEAEYCKQWIKKHAERLARLGLRAESKTFVVKDGVNPLVAKVQPVIDALNAPACEGLEAALRALGAEVAEGDRTELKKMAEVWAAQVMSGDLAGGEAARYLGKIAIALGVDAYNRFVDEFNNGKGAGK